MMLGSCLLVFFQPGKCCFVFHPSVVVARNERCPKTLGTVLYGDLLRMLFGGAWDIEQLMEFGS